MKKNKGKKDITEKEYKEHFKRALSNTGVYYSAFLVEDLKDIEGGHPCWRCKHYIANNQCKAFPDEIPGPIVEGLFIHDKVFPDQENEIIFEPKK